MLAGSQHHQAPQEQFFEDADMYATQIKQNNEFEAFNFGGFSEPPQEYEYQKFNKQDFSTKFDEGD